MTKALATFKNEEDGVESRVYKVASGFSVSVHDNDADESVQTFIIFKSKHAAIAKAKEIV